MSGKSIKPLQATACYFSLDPNRTSSDKIRLFFSKLFKDFRSVETFASLRVCAADTDEAPSVLLLDLRGDDAAFALFVSAYLEGYRSLASQVVLAVCEQDRMEKITRLAEEGFLPQHLLMIPWKGGVLERVIEDLRTHVAELSDASGPAVVVQQFNKGGNREYIEKLNAANSFYADHAQAMQIESGRLLRVVKNIAQDEAAKEIPFVGRLIQYAETIDQGLDELVQFSTQNWHTFQHQTTFDINTVLDTVSSTSIPFLKIQGIELIFEINNNVPARLKGYPLGMINVLVSILELITHAKVQGELIMKISLEEHKNGEEATLYMQFMQSHYRGSVTNVILSTIQKDRQFAKLLEQMDEIEGTVLHSDSESRGDILQLGFTVQMLDRRSYRLPSKDIMDKSVLIIDDRKKNAEILQKMLQYFQLSSTISAQLDEAMMHVQDHEYDVVIVAERLAKRCAKSCKQMQTHEKFIVVNTEKGVHSTYLGLDLADSFLNEPYTHKKIFNAIVDIFSDESVEGRMEDVATLKSYVGLLAKNRRIVYVGSSGMTVRSLEMFLEETGMRLESTQEPGSIVSGEGAFDFVLQAVDSGMLRNDMEALERSLQQAQALSKDGRVVCVVPEELDEAELERIAPMTFVITYLQEPIDPEAFYKVLLDWAMGAK